VKFLDAKTNLCNSKLNISYTAVVAGTNALFNTQDINDAINYGIQRAWDYKPWTFTEGKSSVTAPTPTVASTAYPASFEDESLFMVVVNGVPWHEGKRNFADYMRWLSDYPTDKSTLWTEYARNYYLNQNAYVAGQAIDLYGKLRCTRLSADADLLPFSPTTDAQENAGNQAIIDLAYAYLLNGEKKKNPTQAMAVEKIALSVLDNVWKPLAERKALKNPQNRPMFNTTDNYAARRTRYNTQIGNFP
jgi:hypothetical protein